MVAYSLHPLLYWFTTLLLTGLQHFLANGLGNMPNVKKCTVFGCIECIHLAMPRWRSGTNTGIERFAIERKWKQRLAPSSFIGVLPPVSLAYLRNILKSQCHYVITVQVLHSASYIYIYYGMDAHLYQFKVHNF